MGKAGARGAGLPGQPVRRSRTGRGVPGPRAETGAGCLRQLDADEDLGAAAVDLHQHRIGLAGSERLLYVAGRLPRGVVITSLDGKGIAADAGLEVGDVILQVGDSAVRTPGDVEKALQASTTDAVLMHIDRRGAKIFVGVKLA